MDVSDTQGVSEESIVCKTYAECLKCGHQPITTQQLKHVVLMSRVQSLKLVTFLPLNYFLCVHIEQDLAHHVNFIQTRVVMSAVPKDRRQEAHD